LEDREQRVTDVIVERGLKTLREATREEVVAVGVTSFSAKGAAGRVRGIKNLRRRSRW
jgi:hypothetical protein